MEKISDYIAIINDYIWGYPLIVLLMLAGIVTTISIKGASLRYISYGLKEAFSFKKNKQSANKEGDISPFAALMTVLAATVGTGNIVGVATAITLGGPGAVFWMWITALVMMSVKYAEALLAIKYRTTDSKGMVLGGPMYYIENGLGSNWKFLAVAYAVFCGIASFGIGNMVQANSLSTAMVSTFNVSPNIVGLLTAAFIAIIIIGGIKRTSFTSSIIVPIMAMFYIGIGLLVLIFNFTKIPAAIFIIVDCAFNGVEPMTGGFLGATMAAAMRFGIARGIFSNEAGLGNASIVAATAQTDYPARQGMVSMLSTFIDTIIVCSITGIVIVMSGVWQQAVPGVFEGSAVTVAAFSTFLPQGLGNLIINIALILFTFSTMLAWSYFGEKCFVYLFGEKASLPYKMVYVVAVYIGAVTSLNVVWNFADIFNGLTVIPNLIAILLLTKVIRKETEKFIPVINFEKNM